MNDRPARGVRERRVLAVALAREAGRRIRQLTRPSRARSKSTSADLLTSTDLAIERFLQRRIARAFPRDAVVGEETDGAGALDLSRPTWFLDPVDGTTNYFHGIPHYACNIGFWDGEVIAAGATADVCRRTIYWAQAGLGSFAGRERLRVSTTRTLERAVLTTGFPYDRRTNPDDNLREFAAITPVVRDVRRLGCAGLDMAWVARGLLDGYWEQRNGPWDWTVGALLVREAGGVAVTYDGVDWVPGAPSMVACAEPMRDVLLSAVRSARSGERVRDGAAGVA